MQQIRNFILFLGLWLTSLVAQAQQILPFSQHFETGSRTIFCTFRDADGIWWNGTSQGLFTSAQLMGSANRVYKRHPELENNIVQIQQDNMGRLWLKTQANKYMIYTPRTNELIYDVEKYLREANLRNVKYDFRTHIDAEGKAWIYKDRMLYVHDFRNHVTKFLILPASTGRIIGIANCGKRSVVLTEKAAYLTSSVMGKIRPVLFTRTPESFQYGQTLCEMNSKGDLWVYANSHLYTYFAHSKTWKLRQEIVPDVTSILRLPDDQFYIATSNTGIFVYDSKGNLKSHVFQSLPLVNGLVNNHIQSLFYDPQSHVIAVAYHKHDMSLFLADSHELREHYVQWSGNHFNVEDIICFAPADEQSVWVGTEDNGAYRIMTDGSDKIVENRFPKTAVTVLMKDKQGKLWAGIYHGGLCCSDGEKFFPGESPYHIIEVSPRRLIVLLNGKGIFALDPQTGQTTPIPTENPWIMDLAQMGNYIYAATPLFLYQINMYTLKSTTIPASAFKHSNFSNANKTLLADRRGWIWLVNYKGHSPVDIYDTKTGRTFQCRQLQDYDISSLREDGHGHIWFATDQGMVIVRVNKNKDEKISAEEPYSFDLYCFGKKATSFFNLRAMMNVDRSRLMVGTTQGFRLLDVNQLEKSIVSNQITHQMIISSLRVNDNYVSPGMEMDGRVLVSSDLPYLKDLHLRYYENNLLIECHPKGLEVNELSSYKYKLEGLNKEWLPMENHIITLSNLPSGKYKLLLKKQDINHHENQEIVLLNIEIDSPIWSTGWAYCLYLIIVALLCYFRYRYYHRRQKFREKMREIRAAAKHEKEVNDMKLQFFTDISHDLRTPLTLIITPVETLMNTVKDADMQLTLSIIYRNARNLFGLVNQILDFRKLERSSGQLNLSYGDVVAFVREKMVGFQLMAKGQNLSMTFESDMDKFLLAFDKDKLSKVINNLLSNAINYTPSEGEIGIRMMRKENQLCMEVWDTGNGIPKEERPHIFERFYASARAGGKFASSGLGLNIVKEFADLWGGKVELEDNLPKGTRFKVYLPISQQEIEKQQGKLEQQGKQNLQDSKEADLKSCALPLEKRNATILLVEDNVDLLTYMSHVLSREYNVCQATDGNQALQVLKGSEVDLIISDVMMKGMDGYELCRTLKSDINTSHIPIILLTAKTMSMDEIKGLELGASDYITKPFNFDVLRLRIRALLDSIQQARNRIVSDEEIKPSEVTVTTLDEQLLADIIHIIEENMGDAKFNVDDLSVKLCMHRTNLYKKLQFITGKTPAQFIRMMRLKRGKQLLSRGNVLISQVAYEVGFNDPKKFSRYFKEEFGMYPSEYAKEMERRGERA